MLRETFNLALDVIKKSNVHCLMIGGLAMNQYGFVRATSDVDFMMVGDHLPVMRTCMMETGFQNIVDRDIKPLAQEFADHAIYGRIYKAWRADTENR